MARLQKDVVNYFPHDANACPVGKCDFEYLDGPELERYVTGRLWDDSWLFGPEDFFQTLADRVNAKKIKLDLCSDINKLERDEQAVLNKQALLEDRHLGGEIDDDMYQRLRVQYQAKRTYYQEQKDRLLLQLAQLKHEDQAIETAKSLRRTWGETMHAAFEPFKDKELPRPKELMHFWREVFSALDVKVEIYPANAKGKFIVPVKIHNRRINIRITAGLPIIAGEDIGLHSLGAGLRNQKYPLRLSLNNSTTMPELASILGRGESQ